MTRYYLGAWQWLTEPFPHFAPPTLAKGCIDFASIPEQSNPGSARRIGFFATDAIYTSEYTLVGEGHVRELRATGAMQSAFEAELGYRPQGETLAELLYDTLTMGSDPDGNAAVKTLMPTTRGWLEVHLGGHSPICNARFEWGKPCSRGRQPTAKIKALLQRQFAESWERTNGHDHNRRVLDYTCQKYKVDDWHEFVPANLRAHVRGRLPHQTTITESFDKADSDTLGPDLSWTELAGDTDVVSNQARSTTVNALILSRADSDLSSDDHYVQSQVDSSDEGLTQSVGVISRKDSTTTQTFYLHDVLHDANKVRLYKVVGGTETQLSADASETITAGVPGTIKGECDGSTVKTYWNGVEKVSSTDTAITGNARCGLRGVKFSSGYVIWDDFEAADLAAPAGIRYTQLERSTRGVLRGVYGGSM